MMAQRRPEHVGYNTVNTKRQDQYIGCPKNIYTQFKVNKYPLHNALNVDIWCTRKAEFGTQAELGQVSEMFAVNI